MESSKRTGAPFPATISPAARAALESHEKISPASTLSEHRALCAGIQRELGDALLARHNVSMRPAEIAGIPVLVFTPAERKNAVLLNLHGGGFTVDAGSVTENAALAAYSGIPVIAVRYRLSPEHSYPAAIDDAESVYKALLLDYEPARIGLYGTSAGACLGAQLLVRLDLAGRPLPAVFGFFSGTADLSRRGDSEYFFRPTEESVPGGVLFPDYVGAADRRDPRVSPLFHGDKSRFPPTLCVAGTRDFMLSQTALFHQSLLEAGVEAQLQIHEGMPHAHWIYLDIPESDAAFRSMGAFLAKHLG